MDAEIEVVDGVIEEEITASGPAGGLRGRAREVAASPMVQGAAAATAGFLAGAATVALMRRAGTAVERPLGSGDPMPGSPYGGPRSPIVPGTYIVRIRSLNAPEDLRQP